MTEEFDLRATYEQLEGALAKGEDQVVADLLNDLRPADVSALLENVDTQDCKHILSKLDTEHASDVIAHIEPDEQKRFLSNFNGEELAVYLNHIDSDDAADILNQQSIQQREEAIAHIDSEEKARNIVQLLRYEEDCAGGLMAAELIKARLSWTVKQTIDEIRRQSEQVDKILTVYVVDDRDILLGRLPVKKMLLAKDETKVSELYEDDVDNVKTYTPANEVAEIMQRYDLESLAVTNVQGKLLGRITIDDVIDIIRDQNEQAQQFMAGIAEDIEEDDSVWMLSRARLPWLIIGMVGGLLGAQFIGIFEEDLVLIPAMAFFIPLITATGGNVGIQSSTIVVQSLSSYDVLGHSAWQRLIKVLLVAVVNGLVISLLVFGFNLLFADKTLAMVVGIALFSVVVLASIMGTITPILLNRFGINPALASGPFITTANDLLGLAVYFLVARGLYHLG